MPDTLPPAAVVIDTSRSPHARLCPVPVNAVTLTDTFWAPRLETNRAETLPSQHRHLEDVGTLDNFRRAAGKIDIPFQGGFPFMDSDAYKWLEAAAWALASHPNDPTLKPLIDDVAALIAAAQRPDGYLNTYYTFERADDRWKTLDTGFNNQHELYCAGHFFQAAVAHHRATGERLLLDVALRFADLICDTFGPGDDQRHGTDGHPEIEMPLVELYRITGDRRYLDTAQYLVDVRLGMGRINHAWQEMKPFRELTRINGHAVCAAYLTAGVTDIVSETGEPALRDTLDRLWDSMTERQMYVTGGIGSRWDNEAFGYDYELPVRAYAETCAAIASVMWNFRMLQMTGHAKYADILELALYNGVLSGWSLDGAQYFYQNPLADDGAHRRQAWFGCACCPPNVARLLASLSGYFYSAGPWRGEVWAYVHLYASGTVTLSSPHWKSHTLSLQQETNYPWDGDIKITVTAAPEVKARIFLRVPSWVTEGATIQVNDEEPRPYIREDGDNGEFVPHQYGQVCRQWQAGDVIRLHLPMPVRMVAGHPRVADTRGSVALMRGPLIYCVEQADNPDFDVRNAGVPGDAGFSTQFEPDLLGGITTVYWVGSETNAAQWSSLYLPAETLPGAADGGFSVTAIPYYAWANREAGPMRVWLPLG